MRGGGTGMGVLFVNNQILGVRLGVKATRFKFDLFISSLVISRIGGLLADGDSMIPYDRFNFRCDRFGF